MYGLRGLWRDFFPQVFISNDWYSPDGFPGFGIPFFLLTPELRLLEKKEIGVCEGERPSHLMKLLRHETAHALDNAYHLRKLKSRQALFGKTSKRYPFSYEPNQDQTFFVTNLEDSYAQAHPDEDWAETFAVWLKDRSWKRKYKGQPCLQKLELVDKTMSNLKRMKRVTAKPYSNVLELEITVEEYYRQKRQRLKLNMPQPFCAPQVLKKNKTKLHRYLNQNKASLVKTIANHHSEYDHRVERVIDSLAAAAKVNDQPLLNETRLLAALIKN